MGLGTSHYVERAHARVPQGHGASHLAGARGRRKACTKAVSTFTRFAVSGPAGGADLSSCRRNSGNVPAQAAGNRNGSEALGDLHHRNRLDSEGRLPHEMRASDYDDWVADTRPEPGARLMA